jgi:hypothetical protein
VFAHLRYDFDVLVKVLNPHPDISCGATARIEVLKFVVVDILLQFWEQSLRVVLVD